MTQLYVHIYPHIPLPLASPSHHPYLGGYSAIKRNEIELFVVRWMDLESVIQSEVKSERVKQILYANTYIWNLKKNMVLMNLGAGQD